jgi:hypothetical protein
MICPQGQRLAYHHRTEKQGRELYVYQAAAEDCRRCGGAEVLSESQFEKRWALGVLRASDFGDDTTREKHWSPRGLAKASGLSRMTISRIWHAFGCSRIAAGPSGCRRTRN